jgi:PPK2 family polyphosphate:nucleotide phosphotransferase
MKFDETTSRLARDFRIDDGKTFRLKDYDPGDTHKLLSKEQAAELLQTNVNVMRDLQEKLFAQDQWALLLIFQAMDAAGKDGMINHVFSGVNPQGCEVWSFKQPSAEELNHDFLWRTNRRLPERGHIGIFNRSYYEEVLVVRVHREFLLKEQLPIRLVTKSIWGERFEDICNLEHYLTRNGVVVRKFFLHISREEQRQRFLKRLDESLKNWKFSDADVREREHWDEYMAAYEDMIRHTTTSEAPWYVVPSDHKWFSRAVVSAAIIKTLDSLNLAFPTVDAARGKDLEAARRHLANKKS